MYSTGYVSKCIFVEVAFDVEYADEFEAWWNGLSEAEQISVSRNVSRLSDEGPLFDAHTPIRCMDQRFRI